MPIGRARAVGESSREAAARAQGGALLPDAFLGEEAPELHTPSHAHAHSRLPRDHPPRADVTHLRQTQPTGDEAQGRDPSGEQAQERGDPGGAWPGLEPSPSAAEGNNEHKGWGAAFSWGARAGAAGAGGGSWLRALGMQDRSPALRAFLVFMLLVQVSERQCWGRDYLVRNSQCRC